MIPKVLHHIWLLDQPMSERFLKETQHWRTTHPEWEQFVWTKGNLPLLQMSSAFHSLGRVEEREELLTFELIQLYGGIVVRGGACPASEWDEVLAHPQPFAVFGTGEGMVAGGESRDPLVGKALRKALGLIAQARRQQTGWIEPFRAWLQAEASAAGFAWARSEFNHKLSAPKSEEEDGSLRAKERLVIAIRTIDRSPQYIHQTLASLFMSGREAQDCGEILLCIGNEKEAYLHDYLHHRNVKLLPLTSRERANFPSIEGIHRRCCYNFWRSLTVPLAGKIGVLTCEDDIVFRDGFLRILLSAIREIEVDFGITDYMLSLAQYYDFEQNPQAVLGRYVCRYAAPFYGLQAVYVPAATALLLAEHVYANGVVNYTQPADILAAEFFQERIFALPRPLVQHIGAVSTGLGGTTMDKSLFARPFIPIGREQWGDAAESIVYHTSPWPRRD